MQQNRRKASVSCYDIKLNFDRWDCKTGFSTANERKTEPSSPGFSQPQSPPNTGEQSGWYLLFPLFIFYTDTVRAKMTALWPVSSVCRRVCCQLTADWGSVSVFHPSGCVHWSIHFYHLDTTGSRQASTRKHTWCVCPLCICYVCYVSGVPTLCVPGVYLLCPVCIWCVSVEFSRWSRKIV